MTIKDLISSALNIKASQIEKTIELLDSGATIPFISRYRKEVTGGLDEVQIGAIKEQNDKFNELIKRKETILKSIEEQEKLTPELKTRIENCWISSELEDIYLPYKPKRQTRAEIARKKGLEGLAKLIMGGQQKMDVEEKAFPYVKGEVKDVKDAIAGACDIIAEWINEDEYARNSIRNLFEREAVITAKVVKGKEEEGDKYRDYFDFSEKLSKASSHRILALRRGESEGFLRVNIAPDEDHALERLDKRFLKGDNDNEATNYVADAIEDSYKRLLKPSIETEFASLSKEKADEEAIRVFIENLRQLLLAAPLGRSVF